MKIQIKSIYGKVLFEYEKDSTDILKFNEEWFYLADSTFSTSLLFP